MAAAVRDRQPQKQDPVRRPQVGRLPLHDVLAEVADRHRLQRYRVHLQAVGREQRRHQAAGGGQQQRAHLPGRFPGRPPVEPSADDQHGQPRGQQQVPEDEPAVRVRPDHHDQRQEPVGAPVAVEHPGEHREEQDGQQQRARRRRHPPDGQTGDDGEEPGPGGALAALPGHQRPQPDDHHEGQVNALKAERPVQGGHPQLRQPGMVQPAGACAREGEGVHHRDAPVFHHPVPDRQVPEQVGVELRRQADEGGRQHGRQQGEQRGRIGLLLPGGHAFAQRQ